MSKSIISFVILNYNTSKETRNCIESIQNLEGGMECPIIVVDNNSEDDILSFTNFYSNVYLIKNEYNLGFSKGNNIGYQIAKHVYRADYVVILNSDTLVEQKDFLECIVKIYTRTKFHVLGPDICTKKGGHQNPARDVCIKEEEIRRKILFQIVRLLKTYIPILKKINMGNKSVEQEYTNNELENVALHGACLVFSPRFISKHEHAFYPNIFLYGEEEFLFYFCMANNEKMVYSPWVKIIHLEDAASNKIVKNEKGKKRFVLINSIKSLVELRKVLRR